MLNLLALMMACRVGPAVAVEVSGAGGAGDEHLRGWLGARLLQEGFDLAPNTQGAATVVRVRAEGAGLVVTAAGRGQRSFAIEAGPSAVQRLEVLHRVLQGARATADAAQPAPPGVVVALRFSGPPDQALLAEFANGARAHGLRLSSDAGPSDVLVCIAPRGGLAEVSVGVVSDGCTPADAVTSVATAAERRDAVRQILARASSTAAEVSEPTVLEAQRPVTETQDAGAPESVVPAAVADQQDELPPMHGPPRAEVRLSAEGGVMVRAAADPVMRARARLGKLAGVGGRFELSVVPSGNANLRVVDTFMMAGPDWQLRLGPVVSLVMAATGGADIHTFGSEGAPAAEVSWAFALPLGVSVDLRGGTRVHLTVHPGLSGITARHESRNFPTWERSAWRVGVSLGFSHGWRIE